MMRITFTILFVLLSVISAPAQGINDRGDHDNVRFHDANELELIEESNMENDLSPIVVSYSSSISNETHSHTLKARNAFVSSSTSAVIRYPILGDRPFPLLIGKDLEITEKAIQMAKETVQDCGCDRALEEHGIPSLRAILQIVPNVNIFKGKDSTIGLPYFNSKGKRMTLGDKFSEKKARIGAQVVDDRFTGRGKIIFLNNYFFNPTSVLTSSQQRAIILIHEAVHQFGNRSDQDFGGSGYLTEILIKRCMPTLNSQLGDIEY
jgi:hypothetical protein